jgi:hypothetical protein
MKRACNARRQEGDSGLGAEPRRWQVRGMTRRMLALAPVLALALLALAAPAHADWGWPLRGEVITTYRNGDDPYAAGQHRGIDIAGPLGAAVVAATAGEVRFAGVVGSSGLTVSVRTSDGRFDSSYLHLSTVAVKAGEQVQAGQRLGAVGISGTRSAAAPHLHFGVRDAGSQRYHDPLGLLLPLATVPETRPQAPPAPVPVSAAPAPGEAARPVPAPRPVPATTPRRLPLTALERQPRRVPAPQPDGAPAPRPKRLPAATPGRHPAVRPHPSPAPLPRPRRLDVSELRREPAQPASSAAPRHTPERAQASPAVERRTPGERAPASAASPLAAAHDAPAADGPDLGWALACLGLLVAAALVGTSGGGRGAALRGRSALQRMLAPLVGRG